MRKIGTDYLVPMDLESLEKAAQLHKEYLAIYIHTVCDAIIIYLTPVLIL